MSRLRRTLHVSASVLAALIVAAIVASADDLQRRENYTTIVGGLEANTTTTRTQQYTSGGAAHTAVQSMPSGASATAVQGAAASGAVPVGNPVYLGGHDGGGASAVRPVALDSQGRIAVVVTSTTTTAEPATAALGGALPAVLKVLAGWSGTGARPIALDSSDRVAVVMTSTTVTGDVTVVDGGGSLTVDSTQLPAVLVGGRLDVVVGAALPAGAAIVGQFGIDQTTPGTTNGVQVNAALPAGANTIGNVGLVAGAALVGKVGIDQTTPGTTDHVSPIAGQNGVAGGSGVVGATVQRVTVATDDVTSTNLVTLGGTVTAARAAVNPIAGQAGVAAGSGVNGVTVQRVTIATDDTVSSDLVTIRTNSVNTTTAGRVSTSPIGNGASLTGGTGTVDATTTRVTLATDVALPAGTNNIGDVDVATEPATAALDAAMPAVLKAVGGWSGTAVRPIALDASDRVAVIMTSTTVTGTVTVGDGGGSLTVDSAQLPAALVGGRLDVVVGAELPAGTQLLGKTGIDQTTPGTTNAVAVIAGQNGIAGNTGVVGATVPRVTVATDDVVSSNLVTLGGTVTASRAAVNPIVGQAGVAGGAGVVGATVQRVALATDANTVQQGAGSGAAGTTWVTRLSDGTSYFTIGIPLAPEVGVTRIVSTASNGATAVQLVAATASQIIYPTTLTLANTSATAYTVDLLSSTGPTILLRLYLPATSTYTWDLRGDVRTDASDALQFKLDAAGAAVYASGSAIKR